MLLIINIFLIYFLSVHFSPFVKAQLPCRDVSAVYPCFLQSSLLQRKWRAQYWQKYRPIVVNNFGLTKQFAWFSLVWFSVISSSSQWTWESQVITLPIEAVLIVAVPAAVFTPTRNLIEPSHHPPDWGSINCSSTTLLCSHSQGTWQY